MSPLCALFSAEQPPIYPSVAKRGQGLKRGIPEKPCGKCPVCSQKMSNWQRMWLVVEWNTAGLMSPQPEGRHPVAPEKATT